jgi:hypothetical protein
MADFEREISDPLSSVARAERRGLMVMNVVLAAMVYGGVVPTEMDALGLKATQLNPMLLLILAYAVTAYFAVAFSIYAAADVRAWRQDLLAQRDVQIERTMKEVEELGRAKLYQVMRKTASDEGWPEEVIEKATERVIEQQYDAPDSDFRIQMRKKLLPRLWKRHVRPYERRMQFEIYVPPALTGLNLLGTVVFMLLR